MKKQKIIAIDFDGVIVNDAFPNIGDAIEGSITAIRKLHKHFTIIIWTCREGFSLDAVKGWMDEHKVPYDYINNNSLENIKQYNNNSRKIYADLYIDDRQIHGFPGWRETMSYIMSHFFEERFYDQYL